MPLLENLHWRYAAKAHDPEKKVVRNLGEYEGDLNVDDRIVTDLVAACQAFAHAPIQKAVPAIAETAFPSF